MGHSVLHWVCVFALVAFPVAGCSDESTGAGGSGGSAGSGGMGGMPECESAGDCDDGDECAASTCTDGMCELAPVADGTACDEDNECSVGTCADDMCESTPVADGTACGDDAGTCQQGSCRVACSEQGIRDAIAAPGGPYTFACDGPTTVVTEAEININNDVILDGEGSLTVDGGFERLPDEDWHTVFKVQEGVEAELHRMTVSGAICFGSADPSTWGVGIDNSGTLRLTNVTVSENCVSIGNDGTLTLTDSTVSENMGGGIGNEGTATVTNSTLSGNGSGIGNGDDGTLTLTDSTVSGNTAPDGDCSGGITSNGYNIESPGNTCGFDQEGDQASVSAEDLSLGPLQDNGGPTETDALGPGSFAIDQIPVTACLDAIGEPLTEDQRGVTRPQGAMCDVGAFEVEVGP